MEDGQIGSPAQADVRPEARREAAWAGYGARQVGGMLGGMVCGDPRASASRPRGHARAQVW